MAVMYIDVVWVINFIMDGFILYLAGWMTRKKLRWWRLALGAAVGASYALLIFVPAAAGAAFSMGIKLLLSAFIVGLVFQPKKLMEFLRYYGLFYLASFVIGGSVYAITSLVNETTYLGGMVMVAGRTLWEPRVSWIFLLLAIPLLTLIGKTAWTRIERARNREGNLWQVSIGIDGRSSTLTGLLDTGNSLVDPLTRLSVVVVEWEGLLGILPDSLINMYREGRDPALELGELPLPEEWQTRLRIVPYRGVGGTMGMLLAFRPTEMTLNRGNLETAV